MKPCLISHSHTSFRTLYNLAGS
uniref:Uncharacterized protein n=1 Tax=Arundo donax TaxID=35708 RepID=A0A0A8Y331_ARUDO